MPADFPLEVLDPETFEQIAVSLCRAVIGAGVSVFGKGPDGGREATYDGPVLWSNTTGFGDDSWNGYVVIQAKHRASTDTHPGRNLVWLRSQLMREIDAWLAARAKRRRFPEYLLIVTNARLSPANGGGIDAINEYMQERWEKNLQSRGMKGWKIWHRDQVVSLLIQHESVRRAFPAFLTSPSDQLLQRFEQLAKFIEPAPTRDLLIAHAISALRNEQWVNFGEAGDESRRTLHEVIVDLPMRIDPQQGTKSQTQRKQALRQLMSHGERVLRASLLNPDEARHVLVTGAPGNGKSTLSRYLVQVYRLAFMINDMPRALISLGQGTEASLKRIGLAWPRQQRWPMRIDLAEWASGNPPHTAGFLRWLTHKVQERAQRDIPIISMRRWLSEWPWLVVFDGLDEVTSPQTRREIISHIEEFVADADDADADVFVVVTTRPGGYTEELPTKHFVEFELDYLSASEAVRYGHLITEGRLADDQDLRNEVLTRFSLAVRDPATARLLKTPLQVLIVTFILEHRGALPTTRYDLFWTYYETLFTRESNKKNHLARTLAARTQDITFLHETVGKLLQVRSEGAEDSQARLSLTELRHIVDSRLRSMGYEDDIERHRLTEEILEGATRRLVLLVPGGTDSSGSETVMFEVRSLQELMAARALSQGDSGKVRKRLESLLPSPHWRNTWIFMAGRLFSEPDESRWNLVTDMLFAFDNSTAWPGWLIPVAPGVAGELLDDGLATTKPRWQLKLLDVALRALSEPLPVDLSLVGQGLKACAMLDSYSRLIGATLTRAMQGNASAKFAASQVIKSGGLTISGVQRGQLQDPFEIRSGKIKAARRRNGRQLLEPAILGLLGAETPNGIRAALTELQSLRLAEIDGKTVGVRRKSMPSWEAVLLALRDEDSQAAFQIAFQSLDPADWQLRYFAATELYPVLARQPVADSLPPT